MTSSFRSIPEELTLGTFSAGDSKSGEVKIVSAVSDNLEIVSHSFLDEETAEYYSVETSQLDAEGLAGTEAKSGSLVKVSVRPGLPLG